MTGDPDRAFDLEYAAQGDLVPLRDGLGGNRAIKGLGEGRIALQARFKLRGLLGPIEPFVLLTSGVR